MVFNEFYSSQYDSFYKNKNYLAECDLVEKVFKLFNISPKTILDLGCGTGSHSFLLAKRGYQLTGVDKSSYMLNIAKLKAKKENINIKFLQSDISDLKFPLNTKFDSIISLFAVIGYLNKNDQLEKTFKSIKQLLAPGGIFMFDCWYGPAVINEQPESRIHSYVFDKNKKILRLVTPELNHIDHLVKINYHILELQENIILNESIENHTMRFFFPKEIKYFLKIAGFKDIRIYSFDDLNETLNMNNWNMLVVAS